MAADAKGDEQIRSVAAFAMMNYQSRVLATTTSAKAVAHQNPFAKSVKKTQGCGNGGPRTAQDDCVAVLMIKFTEIRQTH